MALDRFGPRRCLVVCAGITVVRHRPVRDRRPSPRGLILGRALLGLGASASLVAPLAIYARRFPPDRFATLAGLQVGLGTIGTLIATAPLAFSTAAIGWRGSFLVVAAITCLIGARRWPSWSRTTARRRRTAAARRCARASPASSTVIRTPSVGRVFLMNLVVYSSFALIVGLWGGPYLTHVYGYDLEARGSFLLIPVLAQIVGSLVWGPTDRLFGQLQAAGAAGRRRRPRRVRLPCAGRDAGAGGAGRVVRGLRLRVRLRRRC